MSTYRAYGISIASEIPLPPLPRTEDEPGVQIRLAPVDAARPAARPSETTFRGGADDGVLLLPHVACVRIRAGRDVVVEIADGADEDTVRALLLGPALAIVLSQRGLVTLHASAVAFDGLAVAFMGDAGWGKSTVAAVLNRRGRPLVADDVLAVTFDGGRPYALPAFPQLKLAPEAVGMLGEDPEQLRRVGRGIEKRLRPVPDGFATDPPLLGRVYVLAPGVREGIAPVGSSDAAIEFVRHSFGVRSLHRTAPAGYLRQAARLARSVPVLRLGRPADVSGLHEVADAVEKDLDLGSGS
jgi:hypothetical protein